MPIQTPWNDQTDAVLTTLAARGATPPEIAQRMGLNRGQVAGRLRRLRARAGRTLIATPWTPQTHARLLEMLAAGLTYRQIGRQLGLSKNSVVGRVWRCGLGRRWQDATTTLDRLRAMHKRMDRVLAEHAAARNTGRLYLTMGGEDERQAAKRGADACAPAHSAGR